MKQPCLDLTNVIITIIICGTGLFAYWIYIDNSIKMLTQNPEKKNKITIRILAVGFAAAYAIMLFPMAKETLDFQVYTVKIEMYAPIKAIIFLAALTFGSISGGSSLSNIKGKQ